MKDAGHWPRLAGPGSTSGGPGQGGCTRRAAKLAVRPSGPPHHERVHRHFLDGRFAPRPELSWAEDLFARTWTTFPLAIGSRNSQVLPGEARAQSWLEKRRGFGPGGLLPCDPRWGRDQVRGAAACVGTVRLYRRDRPWRLRAAGAFIRTPRGRARDQRSCGDGWFHSWYGPIVAGTTGIWPNRMDAFVPASSNRCVRPAGTVGHSLCITELWAVRMSLRGHGVTFRLRVLIKPIHPPLLVFFGACWPVSHAIFLPGGDQVRTSSSCCRP